MPEEPFGLSGKTPEPEPESPNVESRPPPGVDDRGASANRLEYPGGRVNAEARGDDTRASGTAAAGTEQPGDVLPGLGLFLIAGGIITILLSVVENPIVRAVLTAIGALTFLIQRSGSMHAYWGGILIAIGMLAFLIQRRCMFILIGMVLIAASIMNIFGGRLGGWTVLGALQFLLSVVIISCFLDYAPRIDVKTTPHREAMMPEKPLGLSVKTPEPDPESPKVEWQRLPREVGVRKDKPQTWKTVRIFISSTFRDMHAERDHLVKVVFPELRERMTQQRLHLVDLDLRWGITEAEAEQGKVLDIVLDEINRSRPFFIAILGERYGSVLDTVPEDAEFVHPWLREYSGYSITALEVVHGVLRNPDLAPRSFFYFRDPQFISQMAENNRANFAAENPEAARKLAALKDKIRISGRPIMENYPSRWDDREGRLVDLDIFGQRVLEDLWAAICAQYPEEAPEADPLAIERQMHEAFVEERSRLHIGRVAEAARLTKYVHGADRRPVVITGESGCGKSAFLASWYRQYTADHPGDFVLAYFIGASPDSTNYVRLLRNMCEELKREFALEEEIPRDDKKLSETLAMLLAAVSRGKSRIVMVLDALDQLSPLEGAHGLGWLLDYMPEKARLVVSSLEGDCLDVLRRRNAEEIPLPSLTTDEQQQIVQGLLSEWRRKLDDQQMAALLAQPGVKNPLYLRVALEELRLFGRFERLTERIEALAEDVLGLFAQVLARLEEDHGRELVAEAFALLGCSRYGLSETELLDLLRPEGEEQFPRALWARLARSAKEYLVQRGELVNFFHRQLAEAVATRYLSQDNKHTKLAAYFEQAPLERKLDEYPYQLQHAEQREALAAALSDLDFFAYAWDRDRKYEWMAYWRSLEGRFEPAPCYQAAIDAKVETEGETQDVAKLLHQIGGFLNDMALYRDALLFEECALAIRDRTLGPDHPDVATSLNNIAMVQTRRLATFDFVIPLLGAAMEIQERALGPDHLDVAQTLHNMALAYVRSSKRITRATTRRGYLCEVLPLLERALAIQERALGPDHLHVAQTINDVALLYNKLGIHAKALLLSKRALAISERTLGPDHPDVVQLWANVALVHADDEHYSQTLSLLDSTLPRLERTLGPDHPDLAKYLYNVAMACRAQGDYGKALPLLERSLAIWLRAVETEDRRRMPGGEMDRTEIENALCEAYREEGKFRRWLSLTMRSSRRALRDVGIAVFWWLIFAGPIGMVLSVFLKQISLVFYTAIITVIGLLLTLPLEARRKLHLIAIGMLIMLTSVLKLAGILNIIGGEFGGWIVFGILQFCLCVYMWWKHSVYIIENIWCTEAGVQYRLLELSWAFSKYDEYRRPQTWAILERHLGPNHPDLAKYLCNVAMAYGAQGEHGKALPLYQRALAIRERALGPDHPHVAESLNSLALSYHDQGEYSEALPLYQRAVSIAEAALGPENPNTKLFKSNLKACQDAMR